MEQGRTSLRGTTRARFPGVCAGVLEADLLRALVRRAAYQGDRVLLRLELADGGELLAYADRRYATGETVGCSVLRGTLVAEE